MKNRLIIFLSLFILLGCSSQKNTTSYSKKQYNEYVIKDTFNDEELYEVKEEREDIDFTQEFDRITG